MVVEAQTRKELAKEFIKTWSNVDRGHEDKDRQTFWIDLLNRVYGITNYANYVNFEKNVQVKQDNGKVNTKHIDVYIPSTKVMIEMKGKNINLSRTIRQSDGKKLTPFEQAKRYSDFLPVSEKPKWIIVSNFKQIDIHDMDKPLDKPKTIMLEDLSDKYKELGFLINTHKQKIINEEKLSFEAGELVAKIYNKLSKAYAEHGSLDDGHIQKSLNMLIVRLVFLMYVDDTSMFGEKDLFESYMAKIEASYWRKALIELFQILNTKIEDRDPYLEDELKQFPYVNGGMFSETNVVVPQFNDELKDLILNEACRGFDWSEISPTIFGAVFESTLNPETRRSGGMHYTSIENIHKVIDPLFLNDLKAELKKIQDMVQVNQRKEEAKLYQRKLANLKFFDPACGSGNFLTETYLSIRQLENEAIKIMQGNNSGLAIGDYTVKVSITNFYGIEINDFAVSVAKTAMWIAESQMMTRSKNEGIYFDRDFFPLTTNTGIHEGNALRMNWEDIVKPYELNYIMGNPPFTSLTNSGSNDKESQKKQKEDINIVFEDLPKHGKLDYVCGWYEKAANFISKTTITVSFVSTDSITQGEQVGILWKHLIQEHRIKIIFAYRTFPWSSEASNNANVNCVIIGFSCDKTYNNEYIIFDNKEKYIASHINGYLLDMPDVYIQSRRKKSLQDVPQIIQGNKPIDGGNLILSEKEKQDLINRYPSLKNVIKLYIGSKELIKNKKRYCLWLNGVEPSVYSGIPEIRKRLQGVIDIRKNSPTKVVRENATATPAIFSQIRQPQTSYLAIPEVSGCTRKYIPIDFLDPNIIASNKLYLIPTTSIYLFGIIESIVHMTWMRMTAGRKSISYSYSLAVYTNFPFPELDDKQRKVISKTAQSILDARRLYPNSSLADLYGPLTMPKELQDAHKANDKVILKAYGLSVNSSESEILQKLFAMYEELASKGNK